jgi:Ca2+-binding EF-hand superfamily protein
MHKIVLSLAVLGFTASTAFAQAPTSFADVDTDGNGELSFAELQLVWPDLTQAEFDTADVDSSGGLAVDELNTLQPASVPAPADSVPLDPAAAPQ